MLHGPSFKRIRKQSKIEGMRRSYDRLKRIANQYENTLIEIMLYQDKFAYGSNPARRVLEKVRRELDAEGISQVRR